MASIEKSTKAKHSPKKFVRNILNKIKPKSPPKKPVNPLIKEAKNIKAQLKKYETYPDTPQKNPQNVGQDTFHDAPLDTESNLREALETSHRKIETHSTAIRPQLIQLRLEKKTTVEIQELQVNNEILKDMLATLLSTATIASLSVTILPIPTAILIMLISILDIMPKEHIEGTLEMHCPPGISKKLKKASPYLYSGLKATSYISVGHTILKKNPNSYLLNQLQTKLDTRLVSVLVGYAVQATSTGMSLLTHSELIERTLEKILGKQLKKDAADILVRSLMTTLGLTNTLSSIAISTIALPTWINFLIVGLGISSYFFTSKPEN